MSAEEVKNPTAGEAGTPEISQEHAPSSSERETTDIPSTDKPQSEEKKPEKKPVAKPAAEKAAKKEKGPAVEDKPFTEFIQQDYLPALQSALAKQGVQDLDLNFTKQRIPVQGFTEDCWQIVGKFQQGKRQFNVYFPKEDIQGQRAFSCTDNGTKTSTIEPFLIDERKITLDLMVFGVVQRLNAQKWLNRN